MNEQQHLHHIVTSVYQQVDPNFHLTWPSLQQSEKIQIKILIFTSLYLHFLMSI